MDIRVRSEGGGPDFPTGNAVNNLDERARGELEKASSTCLSVGYFRVLDGRSVGLYWAKDGA